MSSQNKDTLEPFFAALRTAAQNHETRKSKHTIPTYCFLPIKDISSSQDESPIMDRRARWSFHSKDSHLDVENIRLELHEQLVRRHATIHFQAVEVNLAVHVHRSQHLLHLRMDFTCRFSSKRRRGFGRPSILDGRRADEENFVEPLCDMFDLSGTQRAVYDMSNRPITKYRCNDSVDLVLSPR